MSNVTIIGIDLAKRIFHAHGAHIDGSCPPSGLIGQIERFA